MDAGLINKLHNTDCMEYMRKISDNSVDLTLTDIPYDVINRDSNGLRNLDKSKADITTFDLDEFVKEVVRITKGSIYIFCSTEQVSKVRQLLVEYKLSTRLCIWEKTNPSPMNGQHMWLSGVECCVYGKKPKATFNEHCKNTVWRFPTTRRKGGKIHPTEKPEKLLKYLIETSSNKGDLVFDPCAGSGSTLKSAKELGRNWLGCELDKDYYNKALVNIKN